METIRLALAQVNLTVGDIKGNREKIVYYIRQGRTMGADIVIFPELALTGYPPEDLLLKRHFTDNNLEELTNVITATADITAIVGFVDMDEKGNIYNAAGIIHNRNLKGVYHKIHLPNYGVFDEKRHFQSGKKVTLFGLDQITFGVNICEDIWQKKGVAHLQAQKGAGLIINISASPYHSGKGGVRRKMLAERAKETEAYICYNNLVGGQDELVFDGESLVFDPKGKLYSRGKQFEEELLITDLPLKDLTRRRMKTRHANSIRLGALKNIQKPAVPERKNRKLDRLDEVYHALILGTRDYVRKNRFKKVVIGLSGGIDSSLTAVIACDAIGKENVIGITMPSRYSSEDTQYDAKSLAHNLDVKLIVVPIDSIFNIYLLVLEKEFSGIGRDVTEENLQARIRGNILMAFSNKFGWLVLTTGNKSEVACGYCTLYGDMAGGFAVIKDVPKTLVYELAEFRNRKENRELIPRSILTREPSAELRKGQKDSDSLPAYPVLDVILKKYIEEDKSFEKIISSTKFDPETVKGVIQKVDRNEYKRRQSPPGIKITPKAFGRDRRLPITNRYTEYHSIKREK